jgi:hypothetical protein
MLVLAGSSHLTDGTIVAGATRGGHVATRVVGPAGDVISGVKCVQTWVADVGVRGTTNVASELI